MYNNIGNKDNFAAVYLKVSDIEFKDGDMIKVIGYVGSPVKADDDIGNELTLPRVLANNYEIMSEEPVLENFTSYEITDTRSKTWTDSIGTIWLQTIIEIENNRTTNLYLNSGAYDIEDASGGLIASKTMVSEYPNVLAPGEKGCMYDETMLDETVNGEIKVLPREDIEEATVDLIRFPVTDVKLSSSTYSGVKMLGRVENTSRDKQDMVYAVAFSYDSSGVCIGQMVTILMEEISIGDKIGIEMSGLSLPDDFHVHSISDYVVYAYPRQFQFD